MAIACPQLSEAPGGLSAEQKPVHVKLFAAVYRAIRSSVSRARASLDQLNNEVCLAKELVDAFILSRSPGFSILVWIFTALKGRVM